MRYLAWRLGHAVFLVFGVSILSFVLAQAAPGSVLDELRLNPRISEHTLATLRDRYGLDRSIAQQYVFWLRSIARGELGFSVEYDRPVGPLLWPRARNTLLLTIPATLLAWIIAIPTGAWAASHRGRWGDRLTATATTVLVGVPELLVALVLLMVAIRTGRLPIGGMVSLDFASRTPLQQVADVLSHALLPVTALTLVLLPVLVRHVRASLIDVLHARFIDAARAQGVPERRIVFRSALRAAANPLISLFGLSLVGLLSASLVVETIMSWPGLGPLLIEAIAARDLHLVVGAVVGSALLLVAGSLIADGLLYLADPRIRIASAGSGAVAASIDVR